MQVSDDEMRLGHESYVVESTEEISMGKVVVCLTMSLDGFIAGPDDGAERPLGRGGERLFSWMNAGPEANRVDRFMAPPDASKPVVEAWLTGFGAGVSGRRTFDIANGWKDGHPIDAPIFVVTHEAPTHGEWSPRVRFVTEGLDRALELAQEAAGDKAVGVSAADLAQQVLRSGQLDEIEVSVVPYLLGGGVRLFDHLGSEPIELEQISVIPSDGVTHLRYRVLRS
jgi:dihydrofolate reductase